MSTLRQLPWHRNPSADTPNPVVQPNDYNNLRHSGTAPRVSLDRAASGQSRGHNIVTEGLPSKPIPSSWRAWRSFTPSRETRITSHPPASHKHRRKITTKESTTSPRAPRPTRPRRVTLAPVTVATTPNRAVTVKGAVGPQHPPTPALPAGPPNPHEPNSPVPPTRHPLCATPDLRARPKADAPNKPKSPPPARIRHFPPSGPKTSKQTQFQARPPGAATPPGSPPRPPGRRRNRPNRHSKPIPAAPPGVPRRLANPRHNQNQTNPIPAGSHVTKCCIAGWRKAPVLPRPESSGRRTARQHSPPIPSEPNPPPSPRSKLFHPVPRHPKDHQTNPIRFRRKLCGTWRLYEKQKIPS